MSHEAEAANDSDTHGLMTKMADAIKSLNFDKYGLVMRPATATASSRTSIVMIRSKKSSSHRTDLFMKWFRFEMFVGFICGAISAIASEFVLGIPAHIPLIRDYASPSITDMAEANRVHLGPPPVLVQASKAVMGRLISTLHDPDLNGLVCAAKICRNEGDLRQLSP